MDKEKNPQIIYFKDLLFVVLKKWRAVLICGIALAILLGGFKLLSAGINRTPDALQKELDEYNLNLEIQTARQIALEERLTDQQAYMENSYLMNLDPYNFQTATLRVYVDTNYQVNPQFALQNTDKTVSVLAAYRAAFTDVSAMQQLGTLLDIDTRYILELIHYSADTDAASFSVSVHCANLEDADKVLQYLRSHLEESQKLIAGSICDHTASILALDATVSTDQTLASQQASATDQLASLLNSLNSTERSIIALKNSAPSAPGVGGATKATVLFAGVGFLLGVFLCVVILWLGHILSDKVYSAKTLRDRTGIKAIGVLPNISGKCAVDKWLARKEGRCTACSDDQLSLLTTDIRCRLESGNTLLLATSMPNEAQALALAQKMAAKMPDIQIVSGNILSSASALKQLKSCDAVVVYEACQISDYASISRQAELINDYHKTLLGCILYGG